ncbi:phosphoribosylanthranilate isomerase [Pararhizobium haloflavum]|uniref:phosphoribosylanthranilate isomerase n=1 Tax=Pararhizobium haloflavum TaxID=2037914 RepID=UPI000C19CF9D|nr:phosphoribosylanthranilate isomerase [Pararhizobium haloflavum]
MIPDIKICGLSTEEAVDAAIDGGASHIGFIFFDKSPRHVALETAERLSMSARGRARRVAVSVNADDRALDAIVKRVAPDMLQLHGGETPQRVAAVKERYGLPVMKALAIREASDLALMEPYRGVADRFLFDAKAPAGSALPGGNGIAFDWTVLGALDDAVDYMLSGGLNAGNIAEALRQTSARGIDVSSGVERAPGVKDIGLIRDFLAKVHALDPQHQPAPARSAS